MSRRRPFAGLTPERILEAVEALGLEASGACLSLHSFENRVFRVGLADGGAVVVKFYRPGRWSEAAILEEHAFLAELAAAELPVVPPLALRGATLHRRHGFLHALFPVRGGRPFAGGAEPLEWLGRTIARLHRVGARGGFRARPALDPPARIAAARRAVLRSPLLPAALRTAYAAASGALAAAARAALAGLPPQPPLRLHGDLHPGNLLWGESGPLLLDFDDAVTGPAVQDLWMLPPEDLGRPTPESEALLAGYRVFAELPPGALAWVPLLRAARVAHWVGWVVARWADPAFPRAFGHLAEPRFWEEHVEDLRALASALGAAPS
ncbi:MAG: serine/threonine protein kinase [Xanthomonadales bacterium]|nr:serine/threonine protein kinase [Xanthomonadales bacterium]